MKRFLPILILLAISFVSKAQTSFSFNFYTTTGGNDDDNINSFSVPVGSATITVGNYYKCLFT
jgi:hypothetical protein